MLGTLKKDFKFKLVKNFLDESELKLLQEYVIISHRNNQSKFDFVQNNNGDTMDYNNPLMCSLLIKKIDRMQKETGLELNPTYAFWRCYSMFSELTKHKDRPSCEVSVTVMIGSDGTKWPIFMDGEAIECEPGDAAIYLGCEIEHWRDPFQGDWHAQAFLHYVDKNGPYANNKWDNKIFCGEQI